MSRLVVIPVFLLIFSSLYLVTSGLLCALSGVHFRPVRNSELVSCVYNMASDVVTVLLVSMVPTVALLVSGWILVRFRNWLVASVVLLIGLLVAGYGVVSLITHSEELQRSLQRGTVPIFAIWVSIHLFVLVVMALQLVYKVLFS